ncbi:MAG: TonB-dependent receptor plug domain-containing protein, partial [Gluconobacter sp.]
MQRSRIVYTVLFSLILSDTAFAAEQENKAKDPQQSGAPAPAQASADNAKARSARVERVEVHARKSSTIASSATKTNTPLVETAQSVTVITRDEMDARGVLTLNQAVRYAAGVTADTRGGEGTRYDLFDLRGFTVPTFLDGLKFQDSPTGFAVAQTDTFRLDRVELLKGPASALYGQSSPGG